MRGKEIRPHIGIFGRRNNGKSSLINALTGQDISIVSEIAGTTTDPVSKAIEIQGIGPIVIIDTAGIDDTGELGDKRVSKTLQTLSKIDLAVLVIAANVFDSEEIKLIGKFQADNLPFLIVHNKSDREPLHAKLHQRIKDNYRIEAFDFSCLERKNIGDLISLIRKAIPDSAFKASTLVGDLIRHGDNVLLVVPIDIEAPEGRLILPQVQVIRDILDHDAVAVIAKEREIDMVFTRMNPKPSLVVTDSQVFLKADAAIPKEIPLTSFSIVLARNKGNFDAYLAGTPAISKLKDFDRVLLLESCTHHVSCDDIGRVKIPRWITAFTGKKLEFVHVAGLDALPGFISDYALLIQCGGCMITSRQLRNRLRPAIEAGVPVTNYGMAIAYVHGIYQRAVAPFTGQSVISEDYL